MAGQGPNRLPTRHPSHPSLLYSSLPCLTWVSVPTSSLLPRTPCFPGADEATRRFFGRLVRPLCRPICPFCQAPPPSGPKQPGYAKQPMPIFRGPHFPTAPEAFSSVPPPRRAYVNTRPSVRAFPLCPSLATDRQHDGPSKPTKRNSPGKIPVRFANPKCMHGPMRKPRSGPPRPSPPRSSASPAGPLPRSCSTTRSFVPKAKGA